MTGSVIVAGARTPMGRLLGSLKDFSGADLGGVAIKAALERAGVAPRPGRLRDHGPGAAGRRRPDPGPPGRAQGRHPDDACPALTINKVCLSGLDAIALADQLIRAGEFEIVVAGGLESMTNAPHLLPKSREGFKYGDDRAARLDGLRRPVPTSSTTSPMGELDRAASTRRCGLHPRGAGRVRRPLAPARRRGAEERRLRRRDRPGRDPAAQGRPDRVQRGRGHPRRHHRRVAGQAAPGVHQGRHHHRRLGLADLRRRRRGRRDEQGQGRGARADLARRDRRARHRRRPGLLAAVAAGQRDQGRAAQGGHRPSPTSTWSRSTRRSPRSASQSTQRARHRPRTRSTSTAARSRSATRSACPAPGSCCTSRSSCERRGGGVGAAALCGGGGQGDALIVHVPAA